MIDVTPDEIPVLGPVDGYVMAQLARGEQPLVDLTPFRFARFTEGDVRRRPV